MIKNIDINKIVVSNKNRSLCIFLPKMSVYRRDFDETKYISFLINKPFLIKRDELLEKYNDVFGKS